MSGIVESVQSYECAVAAGMKGGHATTTSDARLLSSSAGGGRCADASHNDKAAAAVAERLCTAALCAVGLRSRGPIAAVVLLALFAAVAWVARVTCIRYAYADRWENMLVVASMYAGTPIIAVLLVRLQCNDARAIGKLVNWEATAGCSRYSVLMDCLPAALSFTALFALEAHYFFHGVRYVSKGMISAWRAAEDLSNELAQLWFAAILHVTLVMLSAAFGCCRRAFAALNKRAACELHKCAATAAGAHRPSSAPAALVGLLQRHHALYMRLGATNAAVKYLVLVVAVQACPGTVFLLYLVLKLLLQSRYTVALFWLPELVCNGAQLHTAVVMAARLHHEAHAIKALLVAAGLPGVAASASGTGATAAQSPAADGRSPVANATQRYAAVDAETRSQVMQYINFLSVVNSGITIGDFITVTNATVFTVMSIIITYLSLTIKSIPILGVVASNSTSPSVV